MKNTKAKLSILIGLLLFITIILVLSISFFNINNTNSELNITVKNNVVKVDNIQNYLKHGATDSLSANNSNNDNVSLTDNYLLSMNYSKEEIDSMSEKQIEEYAQATYAQYSVETYNTQEIVDTGEVKHSKLTITTRLYRMPQYDTNIRAYKMEATAYWDKSPAYRLKDILAIAATNGSVYGKASDGNRVCQLKYSEFFTAGGVKGYTFTAPHKKVEELSDNPPLYSCRANLPNDVLGLGVATTYHNITVSLSTLIFNNSAFNVYSSYGHKIIAARAEVSLKDWNIVFNGACDKFDGKMLSETSNN